MSAARRAPSWPIAALHLAALWAFAFVQPLFDLLGDNADFFIARGNTGGDILGFAFALVVVPPLLLLAVEGLAALVSPRARAAVHLALVAVLAGAFALELLGRVLDAGAIVLLVAAALAGAAFAAAYARTDGMRSFVSVLGPAPLIFLALFLVLSPVAELLRAEPAVRAATGADARTPVVVLVFDELPTTSLMAGSGRLDTERYPGFARLARRATWYRNATTVSDSTTRAVPSILTGLRPSERGLPTSRSYPRSLFNLLGRRWDQHVTEPVTDVCPSVICPQEERDSASRRMRALAADLSIVSGHLLLPRDLASSLPPIDRGWADFAGADRPISRGLGTVRRGEHRMDWWAHRVAEAERAIGAMRARRSRSRAPLHVIHAIMPHVPWRYFPSGVRYLEPGPAVIPGTIPLKGWGSDDYLVRQGLQRHLLQVGYADRLVARMVGNLQRSGLWDRALVVVTADHGGSFKPGEQRRPVEAVNFADVAGVPLFVKRPGQRSGRVDERPARTIDIVPTIAATVGASTRGFDGLPLDAPRPARPGGHLLRVNNHRVRRDMTMSLSRFVRARDAQLAHQLRLFPPGRASLLRLGPNPHLIGRAVAALAQAPATEGGAIDRAAAYRRVDPASGVVPAFVTGRLSPREPGRMPLAVAVDGRIRAVAESWRQAGQTRFSALVPPSALTAGAHAVEVFAVGRGDRLRLLARLPGA